MNTYIDAKTIYIRIVYKIWKVPLSVPRIYQNPNNTNKFSFIFVKKNLFAYFFFMQRCYTFIICTIDYVYFIACRAAESTAIAGKDWNGYLGCCDELNEMQAIWFCCLFDYFVYAMHCCCL